MVHTIVLQGPEGTGDSHVTTDAVIGRLGFVARDPDGTYSTLVVGKIEAVAEEAFTAGENQTKMVFSLAADGAATSKMTLSSAGRLGIGVSSPDADLHIAAAAGVGVIRLENTDTAIIADEPYGTIEFEGQDANTDAAGVRAKIQVLGEGNKGGTRIVMETATEEVAGTSEYFRLNQNGRVGINTNSTSGGVFPGLARLHVYEATSSKAVCLLENKHSGGGSDLLQLKQTDAVKTVFDEQGYLHIGGTDPSYPLHVSAGVATPFYVDAGTRIGNSTFEFHAGTGSTDNHAILKAIAGNAASSYLYFGDTDLHSIGHIRYKHDGDEMLFIVNTATALTIAAEGDVTFSKAIKPAAPAAASGTSGIVVLDCNTTNHFTITTTANITGWNFSNASPGQRIIVRVTNGGSDTVGFATTGDGDVVYFPGGTEPVLTTGVGAIDVYGFLCISADVFDGFIIGQDIKA